MARPRKLKYDTGEIIFKNMTPEVVDKIIESLDGDKEEQVEIADPTPLDLGNLPNKALGLNFNAETKNWEIVELAFNSITGGCRITDISNAGEHKEIARGKFKVQVIERDILK